MYHRYVLKGMVRYGWALFYGVLPCLQLFGVTGETPRPGLGMRTTERGWPGRGTEPRPRLGISAFWPGASG